MVGRQGGGVAAQSVMDEARQNGVKRLQAQLFPVCNRGKTDGLVADTFTIVPTLLLFV